MLIEISRLMKFRSASPADFGSLLAAASCILQCVLLMRVCVRGLTV